MPETELEAKTDQESVLEELMLKWQVLLNCDSLEFRLFTPLYSSNFLSIYYYRPGTLLGTEDKAMSQTKILELMGEGNKNKQNRKHTE